ncbi:NAD(P)-dependent oxidoreductase [Nocardia sp. NPDC050710]|uniref:NAD(P)-dependent oxidoreductase n=1 Tax=Nocardia sp. NPDC050710 TaxID=3157220 RepID=UPI0033F9DC11
MTGYGPDVVIVDSGLAAGSAGLRDRLRRRLTNHGLQVQAMPLRADQRIQSLPGLTGARALVVLDVEPDADDIDALPELEVVAGVTDGTGLAIADQLAAREILFIDGSRGYTQSRVELAVGLTIAGMRRITMWHSAMLVGLAKWPNPSSHIVDSSRHLSGTVCGKNVAVVGLDPFGTAVARAYAELGATLYAVDCVADDSVFGQIGAQRISVEELTDRADIIVLAGGPGAPTLTAEIVDRIRYGAQVVTVAGVQRIDMPALRRRACDGSLAWVTDSYDHVPVAAEDPILWQPQVVHVPGIGGHTVEAADAVADILADNISMVLSGEMPDPWDLLPHPLAGADCTLGSVAEGAQR